MNLLRLLLYVSAILTSLACTVLLLRAYSRKRVRLLLWSGLCFVLLTLNNLLVFLDLLIFQEIDLRIPRLLVSLAGMLCLLYGFIWDAEPGDRNR
jgi:heme/copper-type cytochrome/quinol oxidase subunit 4